MLLARWMRFGLLLMVWRCDVVSVVLLILAQGKGHMLLA